MQKGLGQTTAYAWRLRARLRRTQAENLVRVCTGPASLTGRGRPILLRATQAENFVRLRAVLFPTLTTVLSRLASVSEGP